MRRNEQEIYQQLVSLCTEMSLNQHSCFVRLDKHRLHVCIGFQTHSRMVFLYFFVFKESTSSSEDLKRINGECWNLHGVRGDD